MRHTFYRCLRPAPATASCSSPPACWARCLGHYEPILAKGEAGGPGRNGVRQAHRLSGGRGGDPAGLSHIVLPYLYDLPRLGSVGMVLVMGMPFVLAVGSLDLVMAALFRSPLVVQLVTAALGLPFFFLTGFPWPASSCRTSSRRLPWWCRARLPSTGWFGCRRWARRCHRRRTPISHSLGTGGGLRHGGRRPGLAPPEVTPGGFVLSTLSQNDRGGSDAWTSHR